MDKENGSPNMDPGTSQTPEPFQESARRSSLRNSRKKVIILDESSDDDEIIIPEMNTMVKKRLRNQVELEDEGRQDGAKRETPGTKKAKKERGKTQTSLLLMNLRRRTPSKREEEKPNSHSNETKNKELLRDDDVAHSTDSVSSASSPDEFESAQKSVSLNANLLSTSNSTTIHANAGPLLSPTTKHRGLTVPKRKRASQPFMNSKPLDKSSSPEVNTQLLYEKYTPKSSKDLAMDPKRIKMLRSWIADCVRFIHHGASDGQYAPKCMIIFGPSGCGKSICIRVLAEEMNLELIEWTHWVRTSSSNVGEALEDFLAGAQYSSAVVSKPMVTARSSVAVEPPRDRLILIDGLPWTFSPAQMESVLSALIKYAQNTSFPIVLLVSDSGSFSADNTRKLALQLMDNGLFGVVKVNPVAPTAMKKVLRKASQLEGFSIQEEVIDSISDSCNGDLRAAFNALSMQTRLLEAADAESVGLSSKNTKTKGKNGKSKKADKASIQNAEIPAILSTSTSLSKDEFYTTLHLAGKVLHAKKLKDGSLKTSGDKIVQSLGIELSSFILLLHRNYPDYVGETEDLADIANDISLALDFTEWREDQGALFALRENGALLACQSLLTSNSNPNKNSFRPIRGSELLAMENRKHDFEYRMRAEVLRWSRSEHPDVRSQSISDTYEYMGKIRGDFRGQFCLDGHPEYLAEAVAEEDAKVADPMTVDDDQLQGQPVAMKASDRGDPDLQADHLVSAAADQGPLAQDDRDWILLAQPGDDEVSEVDEWDSD